MAFLYRGRLHSQLGVSSQKLKSSGLAIAWVQLCAPGLRINQRAALQETQLPATGHGLSSPLDLKFAIDVVDMSFDRAVGNEQSLSDLAV